MNAHTVLAIELAATWFMVGLIWFVQVVHYPLMAAVDAAAFVDYERRHMRLVTWIVAPAMIIEALSAVGLVVLSAAAIPAAGGWINLALLAVLWISTGMWQAPLHGQLAAGGFDARLHHELVRSNWLRTAIWTGRGVLLSVMALMSTG